VVGGWLIPDVTTSMTANSPVCAIVADWAGGAAADGLAAGRSGGRWGVLMGTPRWWMLALNG